MKLLAYTIIAAAGMGLYCSGQEMSTDLVAGETSAAAQTPPHQTNEVISATPQAAVEESQQHLSEGEQRLRAGIVLLGNLYSTLANINDNDSAEKAVAPLMRLCNEMNLWAQGFTTLPPMNETEQAICEDTYLPIIKKINYSIKTQGERLAAAEYYGSMNLPTVLVKLAILNQ